MKQKLLILTSFILFSFSLLAKTTSPISSELLLDLRITTALYEAGVENVELSQDEIIAIEDEEWISTIQETGTRILQEHHVADSDIKKVEWKKVAKKSGGFLLKIYKKFRSNSRINGIDVGLVYLLCKPIENYLIPMMFISIGEPEFAAISLFVPTSAVITGTYTMFKKLINQRKIKKLYGDKNLFDFYKDLEASTAKQLHLDKDDTYLLPVRKIDNQVMLIAVNKDKSLSPHKLTFVKAYAYALDHGMSASELKNVRKLGEKKLMKLILIIENFYSTQSPEWLSEFEKQFRDSVVLVDNLESTKELRTWASKIQEVSNCSDLRALIQVTPSGYSSREIFGLIRDVFIPTMADTLSGWKTGMFKRIRKGLEKIEVAINLEENPTWDHLQIKRLDLMLENACR